MKKKIDQLTDLLNFYNHQYYLEDISEIPDKKFDTLLKELQTLEQKHPQYKRIDSPTQRVGGTINKSFPSVTHQYKMLSLGNTYNEEDLENFDKRIQKELEGEDYEYICELKYDGVAISLRYENDVFVLGATRGDGTQGDDITDNLKTISTIPLKTPKPSLWEKFEVRGEAFLPKKGFERINKERVKAGEDLLANPRNTCSGTLKMQDSSVVASRKVDAYIYGLYGKNLDVKTHEEALLKLSKIGFNVPTHWRKYQNITEILQYIDFWREKRHELPLETDGIVIKINNLSQQEQIGYTAKSPKWAISYKYESESAETLLESITYQVGRTGAITPVANLSPVQLAGTTVRRASLHNANEIERLGLHYNDIVSVEKGGEIIPKVTGINLLLRKIDSKPVSYITNCPACNTALIRIKGEASHYCPSANTCPPQITGRLQHFIQRKAMNIDGIGSETIEQLFKESLIKNPSDLYSLVYDDVIKLERFAEKSAKKLIQGINDSKKMPFHKVLFAIGIRYVGATTAEKLCQHFGNIDAIASANKETLEEAPEIGEKIALSLLDYFKDDENQLFIKELKTHGLSMAITELEAPVSAILKDLSFVISGAFEKYSRDEIKELIKKNGGKLLSSISGKLNYLVAGDKIGPSKLEKATKLGINIISEQDLDTMINKA